MKNVTRKKGAVLRARCEAELKALTSQAAGILGIDESDLIRLATKQFASSVIGQPNTTLFFNGAR